MKFAQNLMALAAGALLCTAVQATPTAVATWNFNNNFNAQEGGAPALTQIDPLGTSAFVSDTVFGNSQIVYQFNGNTAPAEQSGLAVSTLGLLTAPSAFTVDYIFKFNVDTHNWKTILGVSNRSSDNAFYVDPVNHLQVYPNPSGATTFVFGEYHRVSITNDGVGNLVSYLDGVLQFALATNVLNFNAYGAANPNNLMHFFIDNDQGGGIGEYARGSVAQIRLFDGVLTGQEVADLPVGNTVPEPGSLALIALALAGLAATRRHRSANQS